MPGGTDTIILDPNTKVSNQTDGELGDDVLSWETDGLKILGLEADEVPHLLEALDRLSSTDAPTQDDDDVKVVTFHEDDETGDFVGLGLLVEAHYKEVQVERATFKGIKSFDDVIALPEKGRKPKIEEIQAIIGKVEERRTGLWKKIREVGTPGDNDTDGKDILKRANGAVTNIDSHLPSEFSTGNVTQIKDRLATRLLALNDAPGKTGRIQALKEGIKDEEGRDLTANIREAYKGLIEPGTGKPMEQSKFYFDKVYKPQNALLTPYETGENGIKQRIKNDDGTFKLGGNEATDLLVAQGQKILDNGGTFADVEELLKKTGIPKDWWPDRLVAEMQAWRKTEAALQRQRLADQFEQSKANKSPPVSAKQNPIGIDDLKDALQNFTSTAPSQVENILKLVQENQEFAEKLQTGLEMLSDSSDLASGLISFVQLAGSDDDGVEHTTDQETSEKIDKGIEATSAYLGMLKGIYDIISESGALDEAGKAFFENQLIPGLALAKCGVDLVATGKSLVKHIGQKQQTTDLKTISKQEQGEGTREDGGTLANALQNDRGAMNKLLGKDGVNLLTNVLDGAGELAGTFGGPHGKVAGVGLSITSTGISIGSKAIFTGIDWNEAKRARETLEEARAGNPVARVQIFKDSNFYAKMYLVLLAKDGDKLAEQFMISKGISEENLTQGMSEKILVEALLKASGQQNEQDVSESLGRAMSGRMGKLVDYAKEANRFSKTAEYDEAWRAEEKDIGFTVSSYVLVKQLAVGAGLVDISTGIRGAMEKLEDAIAVHEKLDPEKQPAEFRTASLAVIDAIDAALDKIGAAAPMTAPLGKDGKKNRDGKPKPHLGMTLYFSVLIKKLEEKRKETDTKLVTSGLKNLKWTPPKSSGDKLDAGIWESNWQDASEKACLPKQDWGAGAALKALKKSRDDMAAAKDAKAKRKAALKAIEAFQELSSGLENCRAASVRIPAMQSYTLAVFEAGFDFHAAAQKEIDPGDWTPTNISDPITASEWNAGFKNAIDGGFADSNLKYESVADRLTALDTALQAANAAKSPKDKVAKQRAHALAITELEKAINPLRGVLPPLTEAVDKLVKSAREEQKKFVTARKNATFTPVAGVTGSTWMQTYKIAVEAGAVPAADKLADKLKSALDTADKSWTTFTDLVTKKSYKAARKQAETTHKDLEGAISLVNTMVKWPGYDNKDMHKYLEHTLAKILEEDRLKLKDGPMEKARSGTLAEFKETPPTDLAKTDLKKALETAVTNGVILEPRVDLPAILNFFLADINQLGQIRDDEKKPQARKDELRGFISTAAIRLQNGCARLKEGITNKAFCDYMDAFAKLVKEANEKAALRGQKETPLKTK